MKSIANLLKQEDSKIEWKRMPMSMQVKQLRDANAELFLRYSEYDLQQMYNNGKLTPLSNHIAVRLANTQYNKIHSMKDIKLISDQSGDDYAQIIKQYESGTQYAPTILRINTNKYYCVSGNTRLMIAKILGIVPTIYLLNILPNRYTEVPQRNWN